MKTVIEMAREAGKTKWFGTNPDGTNDFLGVEFTPEQLERFAALVRKDEREKQQEPVACDGDFPEGFDASIRIPAQALRTANAAMFDLIDKREWDVPCTAMHILSFAKTAVLAEREACAKLCEYWEFGNVMAQEIRARGK